MNELNQPKPKRTSGFKRFFRVFIIVLLLIGVGYFFVKYYFVFGRGSKAGELNFIVQKGYIFKTYEGRVIQTGYRSNIPGSIQSNEFEFSVVDEKVANVLMANSGATLELHYKEYLGAVPWRGMSRYIVDSIISIHKATDKPAVLP
ncbi:MAG: hypothetical protein JST09_11710 [Bacteroidetes bacterium]|nr:hypothetical protein [Bacteroidota bacterium]